MHNDNKSSMDESMPMSTLQDNKSSMDESMPMSTLQDNKSSMDESSPIPTCIMTINQVWMRVDLCQHV